MNISKKSLFRYKGKEIVQYSLKNNYIEVRILNLGGIITDILVPDKDGIIENIVVKWENIKDYLNDNSYSGAIIGRASGRIADGYIHIGKERYELTKNQAPNTLHGGVCGFNSKIWKGNIFKSNEKCGLVLEMESKDGEEGFPGNVLIKVIYTLNDRNELTIEYYGKSDKDTILNITNHSYFNLSGNLKRKILDETLMIKSHSIAAIRGDFAPSGEIMEVIGTPFDFNIPKRIGEHIKDSHKQVLIGNGYDHPWILEEKCHQIYLKDEVSGRSMEISTDRKSVVVYSTNFPEKNKKLENGNTLKKHDAICFETQNLPIGHKERFIEDSLLKKGDGYRATTIFKFRVN